MTETKIHRIVFDESGEERQLLLAHSLYDVTIEDKIWWLVGDEIETYQSFKATTRKNEYLAGRVLTKKMVLSRHKNYSPNDIETTTGVWGYPLFKTKNFSNYWLSIAHTSTEVAVLISEYNTHPVGLDIECISHTNQSALQQFLSQYNQSFTLQEMHLYWSAKEAVAKALRTGFTIPETLFEIEKIQEISGTYLIKFKKLQRLQATAWIQNNRVVCLAYPVEWTFKSLYQHDFFEDNKKEIKTRHYD